MVDKAVDVPAASPGRRRDPTIVPKVLKAALRLYAHAGWAGFTFDTVAREAGVGKPALYRRWDSPAHLLISAFDLIELPTAKDCGSFEADLRYLANEFIEWFSVPERSAISTRLNMDREINEDLALLYDKTVYAPRVAAVRAISSRAKERGEIGPNESSLMAVEIVLGALSVRTSFTPNDQMPKLVGKLPAYIDQVIQILLTGLRVQASKNDHSLAVPRKHATEEL